MTSIVDIILIDDNTSTLKTLSAGLKDIGYRVTTAATGSKALELIRQKPFNILITDIKLPDISGVEILETAKEIYPETVVIMITGHASIETAVDAINEGAYAYVLKPVAMTELETIINNALREQRLLIENRKLVESLQQSNKSLEEANRALDQANRAKSGFMAKMSHELRTPLNSIIGFSEVLLDDTMAPQDRVTHYEFLQYIHTSTKHLLNLIDGILDLSKVESGKTILEPGDFNLLCLLEDVRMTVLPMLTSKKQTLNIKIDEDVPAIYADEAKIKQVFLNLISNAHKFTPEDGTISVTCTMEKPHLIYCSVIDNGIGISPQDHQKIFEEFGQVEGSTGAGHQGAGLGLAIARRLIELNGGAIWLTSEIGSGSNFTFSIPVIHREDR